jgi:catechol 2,3-dioxygenase-like lactoylglutathione lyase family enzyme
MPLGPIEAVRVFTTKLAAARQFYAETLGLPETCATDAAAIFDTGQAKLIVEQVDDGDPEAAGLVGRFAAFSFTVTSMEAALSELRRRSIEWLCQSERQPWGGLLSHFKDLDGNIRRLKAIDRKNLKRPATTDKMAP